MHSLTQRLQAVLAAPARHDAFDPHAELAALLGGMGMAPGDAGGTITFQGADPIVPSTLRLGGAAALRWWPSRWPWPRCGA